VTSFLNKRSGAQFYDWKPMRLIFDILHKNFQEDQLNSRRFPGVVDTLLLHEMMSWPPSWKCDTSEIWLCPSMCGILCGIIVPNFTPIRFEMTQR